MSTTPIAIVAECIAAAASAAVALAPAKFTAGEARREGSREPSRLAV
jgi:hypothetical protein